MNATITRCLLASVALGGLAGALLSAPTAKADADGFLDRLQSLGWYDDRGPSHLVANGYLVCQMLGRGQTGVQVARNIYVNTDASVTEDDAAWFVIISVEELCPQYDHRTDNQGVAA